jgi:hypothetical protein
MEGLHTVGGNLLNDKYQIFVDCVLGNCVTRVLKGYLACVRKHNRCNKFKKWA